MWNGERKCRVSGIHPLAAASRPIASLLMVTWQHWWGQKNVSVCHHVECIVFYLDVKIETLSREKYRWQDEKIPRVATIEFSGIRRVLVWSVLLLQILKIWDWDELPNQITSDTLNVGIFFWTRSLTRLFESSCRTSVLQETCSTDAKRSKFVVYGTILIFPRKNSCFSTGLQSLKISGLASTEIISFPRLLPLCFWIRYHNL